MLRVRAAPFAFGGETNVCSRKETPLKLAPWLLALALIIPASASAQSPSDTFKKLLDDEWAWRLHENPLFATNVGDHSMDDRLPSVSIADYERREKDNAAFLARLEAIDATKLEGTPTVRASTRISPSFRTTCPSIQ